MLRAAINFALLLIIPIATKGQCVPVTNSNWSNASPHIGLPDLLVGAQVDTVIHFHVPDNQFPTIDTFKVKLQSGLPSSLALTFDRGTASTYAVYLPDDNGCLRLTGIAPAEVGDHTIEYDVEWWRTTGGIPIGGPFYETDTAELSIINDTQTHVTDVEWSDGLRVYPNPASDLLTIECELESKGTVALYDVLGSRLLMDRLSVENTVKTIDVSNLPVGNYLLRISLSNKVVTKRLTVSR